LKLMSLLLIFQGQLGGLACKDLQTLTWYAVTAGTAPAAPIF